MTRARTLFLLDVLLLLATAFLQEPRRTSLPGHEWLAVAFSALLVIHILVNWRWILATLKRMRSSEPRRSRINASLNALLFVSMVVTLLSGFAISEVVLPLAGLVASNLSVWRGMHSFFAGVALAVVGLHVAMNWDWITGVVKKRALRRPAAG